MFIIIFFVCVALKLSGCGAANQTVEIDPDELIYKGDPIVLACVYEKKYRIILLF